MNTRDTEKFAELVDEAGFAPDGDLYEMGEIVVEECLRVLKEKGFTEAAKVVEAYFFND